MLTHRCELWAPEYDQTGNILGYLSRGKIWGKIELAYTHMASTHNIRRNHAPVSKALYTLLLRINHHCARDWRIFYKNKYFAILSEPIFRDQDHHQYFIQTLEASEI